MNACEYDPVSKAFKLISSPGIKVKIHPSSCLAMHRPTTIVFTELVRTKDLFARYRIDTQIIHDSVTYAETNGSGAISFNH